MGSLLSDNNDDCDQVVFFSPTGKSEFYNGHLRRSTNLLTESNAKIITDFLAKTRKSIDVCVMFVNCTEIIQEILKAADRGCVVRILMDSCGIDTSLIRPLIGKRCVSVISAVGPTEHAIMHHKFAVRDSECLLTGSINWTTQALSGSYDNVLITRDSDLVREYQKRFNEIWKQSM